ncbi:hypothetical protein BOX15_Mlig024731g1 [Macrostomum lignano]|uniref:MARVEL domain-containing protein n=1 Tax=Macrostomum lignano TaxID=282301 RepID=A0A267GSK8_9PLAT|nr:hypothetical protein BOX15_Mlig024731g1 [Macrostomum lignano]
MISTNPKKPDKLQGNPIYDLPFYGAFATTLASILLHFLAFCSPYWLESYPDTKNPFLKLGLWSVCFDKFVHPKDNFGIEWTGCYWIFDWNLWNKGIWEWIDPPWLIAVQAMCGLAFICHCVSLLCSLFHFLIIGTRSAESAICCGTQGTACVFLCISVIVFGVKVEDRDWMPRPDHNHLSWSYAFAVLSCFFSAISCVFLYMVYKNDKEDDNRQDGQSGFAYLQPGAQPPAMSAAGSVYAAGTARGQGQHTMSLHSGYSQGAAVGGGGYRSGAY